MHDATFFAQVTAHAKAYGFLYPSSEIYGGLQAVYDYGPHGIACKRKLHAFWWQSMTRLHPQIVGLDAAILMAPRVWEASGHVAGFHDWLVDHAISKKRYRVDVLLEEKAQAWEKQGRSQEAQALMDEGKALLDKEDGEGLRDLLIQAQITCPVGKSAAWTVARPFELMFSTSIGATQPTPAYLRPETAQGIFVNFLNVQKTTRKALPFGIAQIGKAFRNELIARQFIFRMKEFEQMEMQYFIRPGEEEQSKQFLYWQQARLAWYEALGIPSQALRIKSHDHLAHYARAAVDIEYHYPFGWKELEGIHARGDFDLAQHQAFSRKKMHYFDPRLGSSYLPHVIETSVGSDRLMLMLLCQALKVTQERVWLALPPHLAPYQAAILPLVKKDGLPAYAQKLLEELRYTYDLAYEVSGSIGKRYARQDLIGTPYCFTIDHQSLQEHTVTCRERDTTRQWRLPITALASFLQEKATLPAHLAKIALPPMG